MNITLNGEASEIANQLNVTQLLNDLSLMPAKVAVEVNLQIVPRSVYSKTIIKDGDRIEIVRFIGGG
ncbi:MAG: sulfur carrier protein ThiS [Robiginitomaculum sp.]|nr:sulfur carrier protein ThiS [Robiginitomaculum sp.]